MLNFAKSFAVALMLTVTVLGQQNTTNPILQTHKIQEKPLIEIQRTPCYGECRSYKVVIYTDGKVLLSGMRRYYEPGKTIESRITPEQLEELNKTIQNIKYFSLNRKYTNKTDGCSVVSDDYPSAIITIRIGNREKKINHYYGCRENIGDTNRVYPHKLYELEKKIDKMANVEQMFN